MPISLSIIIPIAPGETEWKHLIDDITATAADWEILLSAGSSSTIDATALPSIRWVQEGAGRAEQLNAGASQARGDILWFLHADSRINKDTIQALKDALNQFPDSLLYFDLQFSSEGGPFMKLNEWGANFRSRFFGIPFGDQGFCISKVLFERCGHFPEGLPYGEDHVFVWKAKQQNIPIRSTGHPLYTSSRKYKKNGWSSTTIRHQYLWFKQAWPEWRQLRKRETR